mmetsp:Transcript_20964/g.34162  ORF Transcript_20964/g.34162 Transcript_20964/m.34162 type:complete len:97 (-) Transcript_20964:1505-1795(-)
MLLRLYHQVQDTSSMTFCSVFSVGVSKGDDMKGVERETLKAKCAGWLAIGSGNGGNWKLSCSVNDLHEIETTWMMVRIVENLQPTLVLVLVFTAVP